MEWTREYFRERRNFLDSTVMHFQWSAHSIYNLEALLPEIPPNKPTFPITQIHRLSFIVFFFSSSHFLVTIPATCFKSSFWQTTNKLKHIHITQCDICRTLLKKKIHTVQKTKKEKKTRKEKHLHFCFFSIFSLAFLEKRYTVASYQSHITCRYNTT